MAGVAGAAHGMAALHGRGYLAGHVLFHDGLKLLRAAAPAPPLALDELGVLVRDAGNLLCDALTGVSRSRDYWAASAYCGGLPARMRLLDWRSSSHSPSVSLRNTISRSALITVHRPRSISLRSSPGRQPT